MFTKDQNIPCLTKKKKINKVLRATTRSSRNAFLTTHLPVWRTGTLPPHQAPFSMLSGMLASMFYSKYIVYLPFQENKRSLREELCFEYKI